MDATTIKIYYDTKTGLDSLREYKSESYDEVIKKLLFIVKTRKKNPELSDETIEAIGKARARFKKGMGISLGEARKRLGL